MELSGDGALRTGVTDAGNELDAFAYSIAHDLRTPLRAISGFAGLLAEEYAPDLPAPARRYLELIQQSSGELNEMIDRLLALARAGRAPLAPCTVDPAHAARAAFQALAPANGARSTEIVVDELPVCVADPAALEQVFSILLANALEFTRGSDETRIEVGHGAGRAPPDRDPEGAYFVQPVGPFDPDGMEFGVATRLVGRHGGELWTSRRAADEATVYFTIGAGP
jgi:signal transduction histidine kinase